LSHQGRRKKTEYSRQRRKTGNSLRALATAALVWVAFLGGCFERAVKEGAAEGMDRAVTRKLDQKEADVKAHITGDGQKDVEEKYHEYVEFDLTFEPRGDEVLVTGTVQNTGDSVITYMEVELVALDKEDVQIGSRFDHFAHGFFLGDNKGPILAGRKKRVRSDIRIQGNPKDVAAIQTRIIALYRR